MNKTYEFFIDDILRHTGTISPGQNPSQRFLFGDGTFATDGKADIDFIRFCQPACPIPDSDGDGVGDASDLCPGTGPGEAVNSNGCSIAQLNPRNADWRNHGEYVSSLAHTAEEFLETGLITEEEKDAVIAEGARSGCGKYRGNTGEFRDVMTEMDYSPPLHFLLARRQTKNRGFIFHLGFYGPLCPDKITNPIF